MRARFEGKYEHHGEDLAKAVRRAGLFALRKLGYKIRQVAQDSIKFEKGPSAPGTPPHSHKKTYKKKRRSKDGHFDRRDLSKQGKLPGSILYGIEREPDAVIIGPSADIVGTVGQPMEHGGEFKGQMYPARPFMGPALAESIGELPGLMAEQMERIA